MTDAERQQLIHDLTDLSDVAWKVIPSSHGERLAQLLEVVERSDAAISELQAARSKSPSRGTMPIEMPLN